MKKISGFILGVAIICLMSGPVFGQTDLLPTVAWRTYVLNVVQNNTDTFTVDVDPIDYNEPGAITETMGNYLKDFVGNTYKIISSTDSTVTVVDLFSTGTGPQEGQQGVIYLSVDNGEAPYLAPIRYDQLDKSALDQSRKIELEVIWTNFDNYIHDSIWSNINSAARLWGGRIWNNMDGTISIAAGAGLSKDDDSGPETVPVSINDGQGSHLHYVTWDSVASLSLTDDAYNYIYFDGTDSTLKATTNFYSISFTQDFTIGRAYRHGTDVVVRLCGTNLWNFNRRVQLFGEEVFPVIRGTGLILGETGTRNITVTAGILWTELVNRFSVGAINTATGDTISFWYRDGLGGWTETTGNTQIDNLNYDDGDGTLGTLTAQQYGVHWIYVVHDGTVHSVYGQNSYTLANAQAATPPSSIPGLLDSYATLIGKIIIQKSATSFYSVESAFTTFFQVTAAGDHNSLSGLDRGEPGYYGHLTATDAARLDAWADSIAANESDPVYAADSASIAWLSDIKWATDADGIEYTGGNIGVPEAVSNAIVKAQKDIASGWAGWFDNGSTSGNGLLVQGGDGDTEYALKVDQESGTANLFNVMGNGDLRAPKLFNSVTDSVLYISGGRITKGVKPTGGTGGGDVYKTGTPADNYLAVWTNDSTIEGTSGLTYNGITFSVTGSILASSNIQADTYTVGASMLFNNIASVTTPGAGTGFLYAKTDSLWYKNDNGVDFNLTRVGTGGNVSNTGTPVSGQVAVFTTATTIQGLTGLTYKNDSLQVQNLINLNGEAPYLAFNDTGTGDDDYSMYVSADNMVIRNETVSKAILSFAGSDNSVSLDTYGDGTYTGTPVYDLAVTTSGKIIEKPTVSESAIVTSSFTGTSQSGSVKIPAGSTLAIGEFTITAYQDGNLASAIAKISYYINSTTGAGDNYATIVNMGTDGNFSSIVFTVDAVNNEIDWTITTAAFDTYFYKTINQIITKN